MDWHNPGLNFFLLPAMGCIALLFGLAERRVFGTWITPVSTLAWPFIAVATLASLAVRIGFLAVNPALVLLWTLGVTVIGMTGMVLYMPFQQSGLRRRLTTSLALLDSEQRSAPLVMGAVALLLLFHLYASAGILLSSSGLDALAIDDALDPLGTGLLGHTALLRMTLTIYLIGTASRVFSVKAALAAVSVLLALVTAAKSWALVPLLAGIYYRVLTGRTRLRPRLLLGIALAGILIFAGAYLVRWALVNPELITSRSAWSFLLRHYLNYIFAGVLAGSEAMRVGREALVSQGPVTVLAPVVNLFLAVARQTGYEAELVSNISRNWMPISRDLMLSSNVLTLYGSLWLNLGWAGALLYSGGLAIVVYGTSLWAHRAGNTWLVVLTTFLFALLSLSWFETYFWHLNTIEVPVFCIILFLLTTVRLGRWAHSMSPTAERMQPLTEREALP
jgi:hypothetical protein